MLSLHKLMSGCLGNALRHVRLVSDDLAVQNEDDTERPGGVDHRPIGWIQDNPINSPKTAPLTSLASRSLIGYNALTVGSLRVRS